ncbi:hypothetical protein [Dokdonia sp.]
MKKSLKELTLNKEVISNLDLDKIEGGGESHCCPTGPAMSCPRAGEQCW